MLNQRERERRACVDLSMQKKLDVITKSKWLQIIGHRIIDSSTRYRAISIAYIIYACIMLMHHVYVTIYFSAVPYGPSVFKIPWIIFVIVSILLGRMWKDKGFWILLALVLLKYLRVAIPIADHLRETMHVYRLCFYAFFGCYSIGRVLSEDDRKTFIQLFSALWTIAVTVLFSLGIYTAWTGIEIKNLGYYSVRIMYGRLGTVYHPVETGILASISIAIVLVAFCIYKNRIIKCLYLVPVPMFLVVGALTGTRASYILSSLELSFFICMMIFSHKKDKQQADEKKQKVIKLVLSLSVFIILSVFLIVLQNNITPVFNSLRQQTVVSAAQNPVPSTDTEFLERQFNLYGNIRSISNGRIDTWRAVLIAAQRQPKIFLWGQSLYNTMAPVDAIMAEKGWLIVYHTHNTLIQTFLENGIPGLLLFLLFFILFIKNALFLIFNRTTSLWQRLLPLPAVVCWMADMVDCTAYVDFGKPPMTILYVFTGLTIAVSTVMRKKHSCKDTDTL